MPASMTRKKNMQQRIIYQKTSPMKLQVMRDEPKWFSGWPLRPMCASKYTFFHFIKSAKKGQTDMPNNERTNTGWWWVLTGLNRETAWRRPWKIVALRWRDEQNFWKTEYKKESRWKERARNSAWIICLSSRSMRK